MKVPADLREHLKLKVEVRVSLGARDKAEAKKLNAERKAIQLREWELLRQRIKNGPRRTTPGLAVEFAIFTGMEEVPVKSSPAKTGDTSVPRRHAPRDRRHAYATRRPARSPPD